MPRPTRRPRPENLDWDLRLGPAPCRPCRPECPPFRWRSWWTFGNGCLSEYSCHLRDLAFCPLELRHPLSNEAEGPVHPQSTAQRTIARQQYPARENLLPVGLAWYHGGCPAWAPSEGGTSVCQRPAVRGLGRDTHSNYGNHELLPRAKYAGFEPPEGTILAQTPQTEPSAPPKRG